MNEVPSTLFFESVVRNEQRGFFLVDALAARFTYLSRDAWRQKILNGVVTLNGEVASPETIVQAKDKIVYRVDDYAEPEVPTHFETLYRDDDFLILSKPAGIPVHHTGRIFYNTFTGVVRRAFQNDEISPMHRLDRDTGGIMVLAMNADTLKRFEKSLEHILLRKLYLCVVRGSFPEGETVCELPLAEDPQHKIRIKMFPRENGKPCKTVFRKVAEFRENIGDIEAPFSVVEAELFTGRKHQIRAHLASLGHPIVGDKLYDFDGSFYLKLVEGPLSEDDFRILGAHTQMLFAYRAQIAIPGKNPQWFAADNFPEEMRQVVQKIPQKWF